MTDHSQIIYWKLSQSIYQNTKNKRLSCRRETTWHLGHTLRETDRRTDRKP